MKIFSRTFLICFLFLLKTKNVAVLTSTHSLYFGARIRKIGKPLHIPVSLYKLGVYITWICFLDAQLRRIFKNDYNML